MNREPRREDVLSGRVGYVGRRQPLLRLADRFLDLLDTLAGTRRRLDRVAPRLPRRRILALCLYRSTRAETVRNLVGDLLSSSRHSVTVRLGALDAGAPELARLTVARHLDGGKFENLDRLLAEHPSWGEFDWLLVIDDDVVLPPRFLDRLVTACEVLGFDLAQPALSRASHGAWQVTRRRPCLLGRTTRFVEIGPVTVFSRRAAGALLPFPPLRYGWGLELHWAALAARSRLRLGIVDAVVVRHEQTPVAATYDADAAIEEALRFLRERPFLPAATAATTLARYRRLPASVSDR
ncbi:hypothetical protein [Thermoleophilum album]|uniref:Glycosyl transferase family 2 n=1 Tax=Thermoleophilum album TaxID=29539 RepID=A0A1H6FLB2_THEAL|nr:hypothetical protein [Thermoleophilum album]SEH11659.1 hypothetical protein SAMN02745716_0840 [Thermoleophilum album]